MRSEAQTGAAKMYPETRKLGATLAGYNVILQLMPTMRLEVFPLLRARQVDVTG